MDFEERNSIVNPPMLYNGDNYPIWKKRMTAFLNFTNSYFLESIKNGPHIPPIEESRWSDEDKLKVHLDLKATNMLVMSLPNDIFGVVKHLKTAKEMWDKLILLFERSPETRKYCLIDKYVKFTYKDGESVTETYIRFNRLINELKELNTTFDDASLFVKFLRSVNPALNQVRHMKNFQTKSLQSLYGSLLADELKLNTII